MTTTNGTTETTIHINGATEGSATETSTATGSAAPSADGAGSNGAVHAPGIGTVRPSDIVGEMQTAYLDYAMSVIVARALPDVRDGLKPVHRRILYAMFHDLYLTHDKPHKKSARIVGEVLGKYHPHGDVAVYDAMVRMAQDFSLRYPLIDGQGNFGSIDGDSAAAMRYTEARLAEISDLMLDDLDKDTVNWHDNFDNTLDEPDVLPAALPNLLINGASGIAVGMATNVPPHNLIEVVDALVYLIDHYQQVDEITVEQLMEFVKGPDFPTGGILYRFREDSKGDENTDAIAQGYAVGKSRLVLQAKAHFEEMSRGRMRVVVTELPYQTNKTALIERIAALARDGKLEGITDLRDESDRTGMRIVIELNRNADPKDILKDLFKYTPLQQTFGMQMLALVDGQPRLLSLKRALHLFIQHREEIIRRRSEYDLKRAQARAHIVEGLLRALDILDEVIDTIRRSQSVETARNNLVKNFKFTEIQAQAILDMQLRRLAALERKKLKEEYDELQKQIRYLEDLLAHPEKILAVIKDDLSAQKEKYGDVRRTQIVDRTKGTLTTTDLLPQQDVWVTVSADGDLRRQDVSRLSVPALGQLAKHGQVAVLMANTRDWLYLFARDGRCAKVAIHEIPQNGTPKHAAELCDFTRRDTITAAISLPRNDVSRGYLFLTTVLGMVKRVTLEDFTAPITNEFVVMNIDEKDRLGWVLPSVGEQEIILVTENGQSIRFSEEDVRSMGLAAGGVGGIKLQKKDVVVHAAVVDPAGELITMTTQGYAKRTPLNDYSRQGRNGSGIVTHKPTSRTGQVAAAMMLPAQLRVDEPIWVLTAKGRVEHVPVAEIPMMGRSVQGKQVVTLKTNDQVLLLTRVTEERGPSKPPGVDDAEATTTTPGQAQAAPAQATASAAAGATTAKRSSARAKQSTPTARHNGAGTEDKRKGTAQSSPTEPPVKVNVKPAQKGGTSPPKRGSTTKAATATDAEARSAAPKGKARRQSSSAQPVNQPTRAKRRNSTQAKSTPAQEPVAAKSDVTPTTPIVKSPPVTKATAPAPPAAQPAANKRTAKAVDAKPTATKPAKPERKSSQRKQRTFAATTAATEGTPTTQNERTSTRPTATKRAERSTATKQAATQPDHRGQSKRSQTAPAATTQKSATSGSAKDSKGKPASKINAARAAKSPASSAQAPTKPEAPQNLELFPPEAVEKPKKSTKRKARKLDIAVSVNARNAKKK
ncbi:MAG: DNA gyrase subunit A [Caldilineaceae bacterium]